MDVSTKTTKDSTRRLAVCNLDWDRVTATDLFGKLHTQVSLPLFIFLHLVLFDARYVYQGLLDWTTGTSYFNACIEQMTYFVAAVLINLVF